MTTLKDLEKKQRIIDNIQKLDVHTHYEKLDEFMLLNPNLTSSEYVKHIDFHPFTVESFEYILNQINTCRVTWFDIGPFIKNKDGYYIKDRFVKFESRPDNRGVWQKIKDYFLSWFKDNTNEKVHAIVDTNLNTPEKLLEFLRTF